MADTLYKPRRRRSLYKRQKGKCYWCPKIMVLPPDHVQATPQHDTATIDHLYDRFHPERRKPNLNNERRWVLACSECNQRRCEERQREVGREELTRRQQRGHMRKHVRQSVERSLQQEA